MIEPTKRTRLNNIETYLDQLATQLTPRYEAESEIGRLWAALDQEIRQLSVDIQQQDGVLQTTTAIAEATDTIARLGELLPALVEMIQKHLDIECVAIYLQDESETWVEHRAGSLLSLPGAEGHRVKIDSHTLLGQVVAQQQPAYLPITEREHGLALPLVSRGEVLGALIISYDWPNGASLHPDNLTALQTLAAQVANAIQNIRLFATIDEQLEQMATLYHISLQVGSHLNINLQLNNYTLDFGALLDNLAQLSLQLTEAETSLVRLVDSDTHKTTTLRTGAIISTRSPHPPQTENYRVALSNHIITTKQPTLANRWPTHPLAATHPTEAIGAGELQALMNVPIILRGQCIGTMEVQHYSQSQPFDENDLHVLSLLASQAAIAIENTHLFTQAENNSRFLKTVLKYIPDPIFIKDRNHTWVDMNPANVAVWGLPANELLGHTDHNFLPQGLADEFRRRDDELFLTNHPLTFEDETVWADGQSHIAYTRLIPIPDAQGQPQYLLGLSQDITERRAREAERERLLNEMATLYKGSQTIARALSEHQVFMALFDQIRLQNPSEIQAYYFKSVAGDPIWVELEAHWPKNNHKFLQNRRLYLPDTTGARWLTTNRPVYIEDISTDERLLEIEREELARDNRSSVAILPLIAPGQEIGVVLIYFEAIYHFTPTIKSFWQAMVDQAAVLLANRQLIQEVTYRAVQIETAADVTRTASAILEVNQLLNSAVKLIRDRFELYYVGVFLVDEAREWAVLRAGTGKAGRVQLENNHRLKVGGESLVGWCLAHRKARIALDVGREAVHFQNPHLPETHSEMALPLIYRNHAIGALTVQSTEQAAFTQTDIIFLQTMADQLANAIENAHLFEKAQQEIGERKRIEEEILRRNNELAAINRVTEAVTSTLELQSVLKATAREMAQIFNARTCGIALLNEAHTELTLVADYSIYPEDPSAEGIVIPVKGNPSSLHVIETGQSLVVPTPQIHPLTKPIHELMRQRQTECLMIVPLRTRGEVIGTIGLDTTQVGREFTADEVDLAETIAAQIASVVENAHLFEQTQAALSEREQTEGRLRLLEAAVSASLDGITIADATQPDLPLVYINPAFEGLTGYSLEEVIGHNCRFLQRDDTKQPALLELRTAIQAGEQCQVELCNYRKDGTLFWNELTLYPLHDVAGNLTHFVGIQHDITARKQAEEALRQEKDFNKTLIEASPTFFVIIGADGKTKMMNKAMLDALGYSLAEIIDTDYVTTFVPETDRIYLNEVFQRIVGAGESTVNENRIQAKDGRELLVEWHARPFFKQNGEFDYFFGVGIDITERRRAEKALQEALIRTQSLYRIANILATIEQEDETFVAVLGEYLHLLTLKRGGLMLYDKTIRSNSLRALYMDGQAVEPDLVQPIEEDLIGQYLIKNPAPLVIDDIANHPLTKDDKMLQGAVEVILFIPLVVNGQVVGRIGADSTAKEYKFSQSDIEIGQIIADQLAIWLENRQLLEETKHRSYLLQTGVEVSHTVSSILEVDDLINHSVNLIRDKFDFYYVGLFIVDSAMRWAVLQAGTGEAGQIQLAKEHKLEIGGESMIGWSIANRQARIALDVGAEAVHFDNPDLPDTSSEMALPLLSRDEVIGALTVQSVEREAFSQEDVNLLQTMADQLANAIQNARLFEEVRQSQREAEERLHDTIALQQLSQVLSGTLQVQEILEIFFGACTRVIGFDYVQFAQVDYKAQRIKAVAGIGISESQIKRANRSLDSNDIMVDILKTGETEVIAGWDKRFDREIYEAEGHANWVRVFTPVTLRQENIGLIEAGFNKNIENQITETQVRLLRAFIDQTALALDNAWRYEASQRTARREALIKEITTHVRASTDIDTILQTTVKELGEAIPGRQAYIQLLPPKNGHKHKKERGGS